MSLDRPVVLRTRRLLFRELHPDDAEDWVRLNSDPAVLRYTGDVPFRSVDEARRFLAGYDQYRRFGMGRWSLFLQEGGSFVGWCGLKRSPERGGEVDLGFRLHRAWWGRGLATEAARASLAHGFERLALDRIVGRAMEENLASHRILEKIGMRPVGAFTEAGRGWRLYQILREMWS